MYEYLDYLDYCTALKVGICVFVYVCMYLPLKAIKNRLHKMKPE